MPEIVARFLFIISLCLAGLAGAFGFGVAVGHYQIWPAEHIRMLSNNLVSLVKYQELVPDGRRMRAPDGAVDAHHAILDDSRAMADGYFAVLGWNDAARRYGVWLYDANGAVLHEWPVDELTFSDGATSRSNAPHGLKVLPDGSILINFDRLGEAHRLDACGKAIWSADRMYHHSFSVSADGGYWTWSGRDDVNDEFQYIVRLDVETGRELERIGLIEDLFAKGGRQAVALSVLDGHRFTPSPGAPRDRFHPNDVEELLPEMADAFPMFDAGDLLLSLRNLNMVLVVGRNAEIKWARYGPWHQQHDPDFNRDGSISVFDNNPGRGQSRLLRTYPDLGPEHTEAILVPAFQSTFRGKHQHLPNGSVLLTIPEQGQALEIAEDGKVVREINNLSGFGSGYHEDLVNALWLPAGFFDQMPRCR